MITTLDQSTVLYKVLKNSNLKNEITGGIYKEVRPDDSTLEDIVINTIIIDNELIQTGVGNINIHIPPLLKGEPNTARMAELATLACNYLKYQVGDKLTFFIENQTIQREENINDWFINIRIKFKFHNII